MARIGETEPLDGPEAPVNKVTDLVEIAGRMHASTVVIPGGHRLEDLQLVESARDHGIVERIILVGRRELIEKAVDEVGIEIPGSDIIQGDDDQHIADHTVELIQSGAVDLVLKGGISTPVINRAMLKVAVRPTVSLATIFDAEPVAAGRPMILTDAGVTTVCSFGRMIHLIRNALEVAHLVMEIEHPRVAVLSANEKQIPSLASTWMGRALAQLEWPDAVVCGPLSFDLATDPDSVAVKGMPDLPGAEEVAGRADILACPGIDAANILYKALTAMTKYGQASLAGITLGFPVPYVILSRADNLETRLNSVALCSIYAQRAQAAGEKLRGGGQQPKTSQQPEIGQQPKTSRQTEKKPAPGRGQVHVQAGEPASVTLILMPEDDLLRFGVFERGLMKVSGQVSPTEDIRGKIAEALARAGADEPEVLVAVEGFINDTTERIAAGFGVPVETISLALRCSESTVSVSGILGMIGAVDAVSRSSNRPPGDVSMLAVYLDDEPLAGWVFQGMVRETSRISRETGAEPAALAEGAAGEAGRLFVVAGCQAEAVVITGPGAGGETGKLLRRKLSRLAPVLFQEGDFTLQGLYALACSSR
jgi:phosphate butyryltransferase